MDDPQWYTELMPFVIYFLWNWADRSERIVVSYHFLIMLLKILTSFFTLSLYLLLAWFEKGNYSLPYFLEKIKLIKELMSDSGPQLRRNQHLQFNSLCGTVHCQISAWIIFLGEMTMSLAKILIVVMWEFMLESREHKAIFSTHRYHKLINIFEND